MEYGLGRILCDKEIAKLHFVLILVLVEYGLGPYEDATDEQEQLRLNPCFSGIWSRTHLIREWT